MSRPIRVRGTASRDGDRIVFRLARKLESPNRWQGAHWRTKHRMSQDWEQAILDVLWTVTKARSVTECVMVERALVHQRHEMTAKPRRMRLTVERHVPSKRQFLKDDDNLAFCAKHATDALKRLGYLHNDSRRWLDLQPVTQHVSEDGQAWTVITLEPSSKV